MKHSWVGDNHNVQGASFDWFAAMWIALILGTPARAAEESLDIAPQFQKTAVWCWVAVSEMVFEYFDVANVNPAGVFQCGIVGAMAAATWAEACTQDCFQPQCQVPAGWAQYLVQTLEEYPRRAATAEQEDQPRIRASHLSRKLLFSEVENEIDDGNPIITGINPSGSSAGGTSQHVALIVGYGDEDDDKTLLINDPFPFDLVGAGNPYVQAAGTEIEDGQYKISYDDFVHDLRWRETITLGAPELYARRSSLSIVVLRSEDLVPTTIQVLAARL